MRWPQLRALPAAHGEQPARIGDFVAAGISGIAALTRAKKKMAGDVCSTAAS